ncbi:3,4-dihydroxy-2-butanone-4-phosphate synthase [Aliidongia dinghuensis]|uniref:3,4-dihydroxy-2-butanone 4-phosphate synthase n=1 Tax=Aliidongia dinghuensis TaxID=1867774 RepID=A0A8J2YVS2_9PROT|nr:3,4-dihydroxy-2-butanone-4-phosphate synthase [Aliidongia dinghuensis]GGF28605.1 3,4-dihydroxy-2-butanone-4-phosphate synthase [Aliidongia dinghuensis]
MSFSEIVSPIADIIEDARNGRMFILVDDEDRENEGDLVIPAQMATPDVINFMAKYGRGLICLALPRQRVEDLRLPLMPQHNASRLQTAFTVSIEAKDGVTTGISASDRARTIAVAIDPTKGPSDLVTPGHIFPLMARDGGVLVRTGHTEAAVDISRLAGLNPSGVICEIMNDDGTMARRADLIAFAQHHGLKIGTIADLIAYRRRHERTIERSLESVIDSKFGGQFRALVYLNRLNYSEHLALVMGDVASGEPVMVRMHALNLLDDVLGCGLSGRGGELQQSMRMIAEAGRGVVVLIREPSPTALSDQVKARLGQGEPTSELRDYGIGAQILLDLGVTQMVLLTNTKKTVVGLEGYGLTITDQKSIPLPPIPLPKVTP